MKKWVITTLLALGFGALVLTAGVWLPWLAGFAIENQEQIDALKSLLDLVSIPGAVLVAVLTFVISLFRKKPKRGSEAAPPDTVQNPQAGGDVNVAGGNVQTGGVNIPAEGNVSVSGDVFGGNKTVIHQTVSPTVKALQQLPRPPADFTGREAELEKLRAAIEKAGGAAISGLHGQGGVGKTALALKLADELSPQYPDAQILVDLQGMSDKPLEPAEAMAHVVRSFHPEAKMPESEAALAGLYQSVLHGKHALLLMDNARDAAQVKLLIPPQGCALLVTSRWHFALPGLEAKNLDVLLPDDARALLLAIAHRIGNEAEDIAKLCGYLPQALRLAALALAERVDLSPAEYARRLAEEKNRLKLLSGADESVEASINLSYGLLDAERQKRWRTLGVFPDTFDPQAAAAVWGMEGHAAPDEAKDTLSGLHQYSLLEWNDAAKRYRLHDLMRDFARARLETPERDETARRHAGHYRAVLAAADDLYLEGGEALMQGLALFDAEWGNIQAGQAWAATHAADDPEATQLCSAYPTVGVYCLELRRHPCERIGWLEAALAAARNLKDRAGEGILLGSLGNAYHVLGESRCAIEYYEQALAITREIGDRKGEGAALGSLGNAYLLLGETRRAIEYSEQHLTIAREIGDRRGEGAELGNLGNAYSALGKTRSAIEYHEQALAIDREIGDRKGEGAALGNLGNAYLLLGEARRAIEYYEQSLPVNREIGDRHYEGAVLSNLGNAYAALGKTRRAIEYYEQAVLIRREIGDQRGEGNTLYNKGMALDILGERQQAIEHAEAALQILEQIADPNAAKVRSVLEQWKK